MNDEKVRREGMKISIYEGMLSAVFLIAVQGYFLTKIVLEFGGDELILGVISAFQIMGQCFQVFVPRIIEKMGNRKIFVAIGNGIGRGLWILFVLLPIFHVTVSSGMLVFIIGTSFILLSMSMNAWSSWMRDLVPENEIGRYFGKRNAFVTFASMGATYIYSLILHNHPNIAGVQIVLLIAISSAFVSIYFLLKQHEPPLRESGAWAEIFSAIKNTNFRKLISFGFYWNFIIMFSAPYFSYHLIHDLRFPFLNIGYFSILTSALAMVFYPALGRLADKIGHKNIFKIGAAGAAFLAGMWFFMSPSTVWKLLWIDSTVTAFAWSAINLSYFTLPLIVAGKATSAYVSVFSTASGLGGVLGGFVGGGVAKLLSEIHTTVFGFELYGIQFIFLTAAILRAVAILIIDRVEVAGHVSLKNYIFVSAMNFSRRVRMGLFGRPPVSKMVEFVRRRKRKK